jgi:hypothetical protein
MSPWFLPVMFQQRIAEFSRQFYIRGGTKAVQDAICNSVKTKQNRLPNPIFTSKRLCNKAQGCPFAGLPWVGLGNSFNLNEVVAVLVMQPQPL